MANVKFKKSQSRKWESNSKKKKKKSCKKLSLFTEFNMPPSFGSLLLSNLWWRAENWLSMGFFQGIMGKLPPQPLQDLARAVLFYMFYWNGVKDPSISKVINSVPEIHCRSIVELFYPLSLACMLGWHFCWTVHLLNISSAMSFPSYLMVACHRKAWKQDNMYSQ